MYFLVEPRDTLANLPFADRLAGVALRRIQITHYIRSTWPIFSLSLLSFPIHSLPLSSCFFFFLSFFLSFSFFHSARRGVFLRLSLSPSLSLFLFPFLFFSRSRNPQRGSRAFLKEPPSADATPFKRDSCVGPVAAARPESVARTKTARIDERGKVGERAERTMEECVIDNCGATPPPPARASCVSATMKVTAAGSSHIRNVQRRSISTNALPPHSSIYLSFLFVSFTDPFLRWLDVGFPRQALNLFRVDEISRTSSRGFS